jgi:acyl carrier protein
LNDVEEGIRQMAADIFGVPVADIGLDSSPATVSTWDSLQHLNLILGVEAELGVEFTPEEVEGIESVGDLVSLARTRAS